MNKAKIILQAQKLRSYFIIGGCLVLIWALSHFIFQDLAIVPPPPRPAITDLPVDKVNVQDIWMNRQDSVLARLETENKLSEQKMKVLEDVLRSQAKREEETEKEKIELKKTISLLQQGFKEVSNKVEEMPHRQTEEEATLTSPPSSQKLTSSKPTLTDPFSSPSSLFTQSPHPPHLMNYSSLGEAKIEKLMKAPLREYAMQEKEKAAFSVEDVVPAAVSVKALLVSSVDAICGVYANSDPVPVKLRILDDAHLPKGVDVKLKGCLVLASAYGNISNERVYMRLERLTQVDRKGNAVETEVVGFVSGEDGKFGLRGTVIDRSGKIIKNAAASGFLGGIGQVLQAAVTKTPVDSWNTYAVGKEAAAKGAANGASSAFDLLAEYYIKRAEQIQPVLQVNAGRIVDITFTHGFAMGDLNIKEKLREIRQNGRRLSQ